MRPQARRKDARTHAGLVSILPYGSKVPSYFLSFVVQNFILSMILKKTCQKGKHECAYILNSVAYTNKQDCKKKTDPKIFSLHKTEELDINYS